MKSFQPLRRPVFFLLVAILPSYMLAQNVGIGTSSPEEKLHISNGQLLIGPTTGGLINAAVSFNPHVKFRARPNTSGAPQGVSFGLEFEVNSDLVGAIKAVNPGVLGIAPPHIRISRSTPSAPDLTVSDDGYTGIGTAAPEQKLHLYNGNFLINKTSGGSEVEIGLQRGGQDRGFVQLSGDNGENIRIGTFSGSAGSFAVRTNGGDRLTVNSSGHVLVPARVAIGGATANHPLNVAGNTSLNGNNELLQFNGSGDSRFIQFYRSNVAKAFIQLNVNDLIIGNSTGNNSGNLLLRGNQISIGTNTLATGYKLSVGGKVICTELRVALTNSWPDYVFEKDYKLEALEEVESHIRQHKHLPNIPSASKLTEDGLHLGEMQRLQMEKIEELFLHVIALKKEIETVKAENEALRAEKH